MVKGVPVHVLPPGHKRPCSAPLRPSLPQLQHTVLLLTNPQDTLRLGSVGKQQALGVHQLQYTVLAARVAHRHT